jgi:hypothetical protein
VGPGYFLGHASVPMAPIEVICTFG